MVGRYAEVKRFTKNMEDDHESGSNLINYEALCKTVQAKLGLLNIGN